ncbi:hypothetical protein PVAND_007720 [Polypedilum vanderplanki]|uniref:Uncharacterized protein n=1 Tax=Polypedilum vanderplanki TaxID=319348 RepID=A0A9J6C896_POLVA|nr:hypothetical protein PVAND_007720 [Polypedilum vanderplanki]
MSEAIGIETRSRSRSKTPGLLFGENGDSHDKKAKKIPTISLIEEEDVVEVVSSQQASQASQKPKRSRRSGKASQADQVEQSSQESPKNSQQPIASNKLSNKTTTTTTTVVTTKEIINGSEEKNEEITTTSTTVVTANNDIPAEVPENQNIFNNFFNVIKTSTPILSNKRTKRFTEEVKSANEIDYNAHPAYKEYKEAGEYWNKYPKTDYTYSELSPHRRELGRGVVAMPNMSRRSLDKYTNRVETMIQNNPTEESFLRRKFLSNMSYQKRSADLQYDSADEIDTSDLHFKLAARRYSQNNFLQRFFLLIVSTFSAAYSNAKQGVQRIYYGKNHRYAFTPIKRQQNQGILRGVYNALQRFVLLCISKVYLFISTILCLDTWLLYTRSANVVENRKRKRFLLGLLILLPLLLFGGTYIYIDPPQNISFKLTLPELTFPKISFPSISLPKLSFNFNWPEFSWPAWLKWPSFSFEWFSLSLPSWFRLPSFSFNLPDYSFSWPELTFSWPSWLTLPALTWPVWLTLPEISLSLSEWLKWPEFSFSRPEWFQLPSLSFNWPDISFSYPEWLKLPEFSLPKISLPSISFEFLNPIVTYTSDTFSSLKFSTIEFFDKICDATTSVLNEAQIVWNENFNAK